MQNCVTELDSWKTYYKTWHFVCTQRSALRNWKEPTFTLWRTSSEVYRLSPHWRWNHTRNAFIRQIPRQARSDRRRDGDVDGPAMGGLHVGGASRSPAYSTTNHFNQWSHRGGNGWPLDLIGLLEFLHSRIVLAWYSMTRKADLRSLEQQDWNC